jgi:hypothetical protein
MPKMTTLNDRSVQCLRHGRPGLSPHTRRRNVRRHRTCARSWRHSRRMSSRSTRQTTGQGQTSNLSRRHLGTAKRTSELSLFHSIANVRMLLLLTRGIHSRPGSKPFVTRKIVLSSQRRSSLIHWRKRSMLQCHGSIVTG